MNRFEYEVRHVMDGVNRFLQTLENPHHRAIVENFRRHVHLEIAGEYEKIVAPDMMVDHPVYRIAWGKNPMVIEGKENVLKFYYSVSDTVLWHSEDEYAVADWGIASEMTFHQLTQGKNLKALGFDIDDEEAIYHYKSRQAFIWPYDSQARLIGEHIYEDPTTVVIEKVKPEEILTPQRAKEIHQKLLREYNLI